MESEAGRVNAQFDRLKDSYGYPGELHTFRTGDRVHYDHIIENMVRLMEWRLDEEIRLFREKTG